jgi:O-antigen ligase
LPELKRLLRSACDALAPNGLRGRSLVRVVAAIAVALCALLIFAFDEHAPYDIVAGPVARIVAGLVPLLAAGTAGWAVLRPRSGFMAILLLTPVVNVAQLHLDIGPLQVIAQTVFVVALAVGLLLRDGDWGLGLAAVGARLGRLPFALGRLPRPSLLEVAAGAMVAMLSLATLSTLLSPNVGSSASVLLHGILEPAAMAAALLILRPNRRDLVLIAIVFSVSVSLGGLLNMAQTIPAMKSLSVIQANRLLIARITYFNVGLFGEMLAMALPLLLAVLLAHRRHLVNLGRVTVVLLLAALLIDLASLVLTFSKSAYLASFGGCLVLVLLVVRGWRRRASIVLAVTLLSGVLIPWPAFFLQVAPPLEQAYRTAMVRLMGESRYDSWNPSTLSGQGSLLERWYATQAGIEMALDHPLLGVGLDQFKGQYLGHYRPPQAKDDLDWAHSMFAEVAAELGIPALVADLIIYAAAAIAMWRVYRGPPDPFAKLLASAFLAVLVAWQLVGLAFAGDMYRWWRNMASDYVMMMVLMAAAFSLYHLARTPASPTPSQ